MIAPGFGVGGLTAFHGYVVWSRWSAGTRDWGLELWHAGTVTPLPVPRRAVVFDADAGPDAAGRPIVVFSRCSRDPGPRNVAEWLRARGCRIVQMRLDVPDTPRVLASTAAPGMSDTTPSRWGRWIAFARHRDGAHRAQVLLARVGGGHARTVGRAPVDCLGPCANARIRMTVDAMDLGPGAVLALWDQSGEVGYGVGDEAPLQLIPRDGRRPRTIDVGYISGACGYRDPISPNVVGSGAFWVGAGSPCDDTVTVFAWLDPARHLHQIASVSPGLIFGAARDGTDVYWLRATGTGARREIPSSTSCSYRSMGCTVVRTRRLTWVKVAPGRPLGPVSEGG